MAIHIQHLNKYIGKQHVLKDISLTIGDGEVVGLLGPNGAGKSTLMKIMVGVWDATDGEVAVPANIGFLPEQNPLYEDMYVREYLRFFVNLRLKVRGERLEVRGEDTPTKHASSGAQQIVEELIERVGLTTEANKRVGQLSKGYKQRVGLAQAMIGDPELLILDEPTTGLDPNQLEDIRALIRNLANPVSNSDAIAPDMPNNGRSVILSTHILQEVKQMCTRVIIINHGEIKVNKPISEIEDLEQTFREATTSDIQ
jgi:ABC-2 type transport system ATP-binding protein